MSASTGGPYVVPYPGSYNSRAEACKVMRELINKELAEWQEQGCADGWTFVYDYGNPIGYIAVHNQQFDADYKEYPLVAFDVIEVID